MTTLIKLDPAKLQRQIARCKNVHPKARRISSTLVSVSGSTGSAYTVTLARPKADLPLAGCSCKAGEAGMACFHIVAASHVPCTVLTA